jgi:hypothetical protein
MRHGALGATLASAALLAVAPVNAAAREVGGPITTDGGVTITWHGDPERGCDSAGLCAYRGSISSSAFGLGQYFFVLSRGNRLVDDFAFLDLTSAPVVRVRRAGGADDGSCLDVNRIDELSLASSGAGPGRARIGIDALPLTTGRCAGPNLSRALARLPRRTVSLSRLARGGVVADLSGSARYVSGRFSGTVTSTLRLRLGREERGSSGGGGDLGGGPARRPRRTVRVRVVHLHAVYRVTRFAGSLSSSFGGLEGPPCAQLDACGVNGASEWAIESSGGNLVVEGDSLARRSDHGLRGALAAITRTHDAFAEVRRPGFFGTTTADVTRPDGVPCHDTARVLSPGMAAGFSGRRFFLDVGGEDTDRAGADLLRTGCPGPRDSDVLSGPGLATGSVPLSLLARRRFSLPLSGSGRFNASGYAGSRRARFGITLKRRSVRVAFRHVRIAR